MTAADKVIPAGHSQGENIEALRQVATEIIGEELKKVLSESTDILRIELEAKSKASSLAQKLTLGLSTLAVITSGTVAVLQYRRNRAANTAAAQ